MRKWVFIVLLSALAGLQIAPLQASAYSYGDANSDEVAETFKLVSTALQAAAPDWKAAEEAYRIRRPEMVSHFDSTVAATLDANFKAKDAALAIANFKAVLVMNVERRFKYAEEGIEDYTQAKLLLAKARATFETLRPSIGSNTDEIAKSFDQALEALGNPGLFGVGKKEAQPEAFKQRADSIVAALKPLFPFQAASGAGTPDQEPSGAGGEPHAPMERSSRTNPWVSALIIGAVAIVCGGGLWLARKKKWL